MVFSSCFTSRQEGNYSKLVFPMYCVEVFKSISCKLEISKSINNFIEATFSVLVPEENPIKQFEEYSFAKKTKILRIPNKLLSDPYSIVKYISSYVRSARFLAFTTVLNRFFTFGKLIYSTTSYRLKRGTKL